MRPSLHKSLTKLLLAWACTLSLPALAQAPSDGAGPAPLFGFGASAAAAQHDLERRFDARIDPADLRGWLKTLSSAPNQVGSPHDRANAEFVRDRFLEWGWQAEIETFEVLYPTLKHHRLELVAPTRFVARLDEPAVQGDASSARKDAMPAYNVYGGDGDVTGELVYLNYGMPDDYQDLARRGIDVKGKIVITRYGGGWRGLKPKLAQEHGAIGCIIYSDPREDGYARGDAYPAGGWRPAAGLQRGSVGDISVYSGDPLTPGVGATKDAPRLPIAQARTLLKIPVLPISYADAQPLLAALAGPVAPERWRGGLPITYHLGPGPAKVHLAIASDWGMKTLYDVIAKVPGEQSPDEWVLRGNHRDAWVFGAWDPLSGQVAMLSEARSIGALLKTGWRPKRTLVYASWDGEEPGLLGSTEWAETHAQELQHKAVLYLNSDTNARGFLSAGGSPALQRLVNDVAADVKDPETGVSVQARLRARLQVAGIEKAASEKDKKEARLAAQGSDLPIEALGSGSDFTPFLQHLGLSALSIEYHGEDEQAGVYHSAYDSFEHYLRFGDPSFAYGVAEAQTVGRVVLRMAQAEVLPMQFGAFADELGGYVGELHQLVEDKRKHAESLARLLDQNAFALATDPTRALQPPPREPEVPPIDLAPLDSAVARLKQSAQAYDQRYAEFVAGKLALGEGQRQALNQLLQGMEQALTDSRGLPGRDWYQHLVYAPGLLTGYGVKTLPGVREALEAARWDEARSYVGITAQALTAYGDRLDRAAALLRPGS
jgi:N-acetylated-alpha-linked acidic dipeptidase